jgi:hypothetical protein
MKTFIVAILKHFKSFNNLLLNLSIKSVSSFSYIKLVIKYYSYFRYILEYVKACRFYDIFKAFFKVIALINILLGIFTLIVFTEFRYDEYKEFIKFYFTDFTFTGLFFKIKTYIKILFKKVVSIFVDETVTIDTPKSDKIPNSYNLGKESIKTDSYLPYYLIALTSFVSIVICMKYPEYTVTPVITAITGFFTYFFGGNDDPSDKSADIKPLDKGKAKDISRLDIDHLIPFSSTPSSSTSNKSGIFHSILNKVSNIGEDPNDILTSNPFAHNDDTSSSDTSSSSSGSDTVKQSIITPSSSTSSGITPAPYSVTTSPSTPISPSRSGSFSPRWAPPKGGWK